MVRCTWDRINDQAAEQTAHPSAVRAGGRVLSSNGCTQIDEEPESQPRFVVTRRASRGRLCGAASREGGQAVAVLARHVQPDRPEQSSATPRTGLSDAIGKPRQYLPHVGWPSCM